MLLRSQLKTDKSVVDNDRSDAPNGIGTSNAKPSIELNVKNSDQLDSQQIRSSTAIKRAAPESELKQPRKIAKLDLNEVGNPLLHTSNLPSLITKWASDYTKFGKPLFYFHNDQETFFAPADKYRKQYIRPDIENDPHGKMAKFYYKLNISYIEPKTLSSVYIGKIIDLEYDINRAHFYGSLVHLPGGDNDNVLDDEDQGSIAIAEYCFRQGIVVNKNREIAEALADFGSGCTNQQGYGECMHIALANEDYLLFKFLANKGDYSCYESNHVTSTALEQAALLPDQRYFNELLSGVAEVAQTRHLIAMAQPGNVCLNDDQRTAIFKQIERLK